MRRTITTFEKQNLLYQSWQVFFGYFYCPRLKVASLKKTIARHDLFASQFQLPKLSEKHEQSQSCHIWKPALRASKSFSHLIIICLLCKYSKDCSESRYFTSLEKEENGDICRNCSNIMTNELIQTEFLWVESNLYNLAEFVYRRLLFYQRK